MPELFPTQIQSLDHFRKLARAFDLSEYGVGKSAAPVVRLRELIPPHRALFLCPAGVVHKWAEKELPTWGDPRWIIANLTGKKKTRWARFSQPHHIAVMNYEGIFVFGEALADRYGVLVIDEPHRLKDPTGQISRAVAFLSKRAKIVIGLTGSPLLEHPIDLFGVVRAVNPYIFGDSFVNWRTKYFFKGSIAGGYPRWIPKKGTTEQLKAVLHSISIRHLRTDLPVQFPTLHPTETVRVDLHPTVALAYKKMERDFVLMLRNLDGRIDTIQALEIYPRIQKLAQLTHGYIRTQEGLTIVGPSTKAGALADTIEEIRGTGPIVVWACRYPEFDMAEAILRNMGIECARVYGKQTTHANNVIVNRFNSGGYGAIICHPRSVGEGVDLEAVYSLRFGLSWSHLQYAQPIGRFIRATSTHKRVVPFDFVARDTLDEDILLALTGKMRLLAEILRNRDFPRNRLTRSHATPVASA